MLRKPLLPLSFALLTLFLAACSGSDSPVVGASPTPTSPSESSPASIQTLGTRGTPTQAKAVMPGAASQAWFNYERAEDFPNTVTLPTQFITMPDGVQLAATVTLPADASGTAASTRLPTILIQTSYNKTVGAYQTAIGGADPFMVKRGYATVVVDVRGTGNSQGVWDAFGEKEQADYAKVVDWVVAQPWANGKVGVYGVSYLGITAILTAAKNHPAVKAAFPIVPIGDGYRDIVFTGGQVNPTFIPLWMGLVTGLGAIPFDALQANPVQGFQTLVEHLINGVTAFQAPTIVKAVTGDAQTAYDSDFWKTRSPLEQAANIKVPTFVVGGLHDLFQRSEPLWFEQLKNQTNTRLLIGPWTHIESAGLPSDGLPRDGVPAMKTIELMWFDQYLKGLPVGVDKIPNVTQYVKGYEKYATTSNWPHPQMKAQALYLRGNKGLTAEKPAAAEGSNVVLQTPVFGLCSLSSSQWSAGAAKLVPLPCFTEDTYNAYEGAAFRTPVLTEDLYLNGPIAADIWVSTASLDASLSVRVSDYDPATGKSVAITNGLLTASHRAVDDSRSRFVNGLRIQPWHPFTQATVQPVKSGEAMLLPVEIFPTSAMIAKGHQLQIVVSSSNLPQGLPPLVTLLKGAAGALTILSDAEHPSRVVLPVVPRSALQ
ncbi:MAG TPA: CocE/NonD family hydrolase [Limnobacter sp.]|uniref:CocE/NonD family hydrolase n=1 Tax=Limnobacter sp. TaxID=2003368 RepID=UPI002ED8656E